MAWEQNTAEPRNARVPGRNASERYCNVVWQAEQVRFGLDIGIDSDSALSAAPLLDARAPEHTGRRTERTACAHTLANVTDSVLLLRVAANYRWGYWAWNSEPQRRSVPAHSAQPGPLSFGLVHQAETGC